MRQGRGWGIGRQAVGLSFKLIVETETQLIFVSGFPPFTMHSLAGMK
jgi:hypothetical protein